jgi:hypothetical protein
MEARFLTTRLGSLAGSDIFSQRAICLTIQGADATYANASGSFRKPAKLEVKTTRPSQSIICIWSMIGSDLSDSRVSAPNENQRSCREQIEQCGKLRHRHDWLDSESQPTSKTVTHQRTKSDTITAEINAAVDVTIPSCRERIHPLNPRLSRVE